MYKNVSLSVTNDEHQLQQQRPYHQSYIFFILKYSLFITRHKKSSRFINDEVDISGLLKIQNIMYTIFL